MPLYEPEIFRQGDWRFYTPYYNPPQSASAYYDMLHYYSVVRPSLSCFYNTTRIGRALPKKNGKRAVLLLLRCFVYGHV
jgi:hypothetical protein